MYCFDAPLVEGYFLEDQSQPRPRSPTDGDIVQAPEFSFLFTEYTLDSERGPVSHRPVD